VIAPASAGIQPLNCTFIEPLLIRSLVLEHPFFYDSILYWMLLSQDSDMAAANCDAVRRIRMTVLCREA